MNSTRTVLHRLLRVTPEWNLSTCRIAASFLFLFVCSAFLPVATAQDRPLSGKQLRELKMYVQTQNGELSEVPREAGFPEQETTRDLGNARATSQNVLETIIVPGKKAKVRFFEGEPIEILAEMPAGTDPRQLELFRFATRGKQRVTNLEPFRNPNKGIHSNTLSFRAGLLKDGHWKLVPPSLPVGEYCFSPRSNSDNFCFGVDPK